MVRLKSEILEKLKKNNINISLENIFVAEKTSDDYILSFIVSFGSNDIVFVYDEAFGYISCLYK